MTRITVVIAGRTRASRAACRSLLDRHKDIRVVGEAGSGLETASAAEKLKPSVLLIDMSLMDGDVTALLAVLGRKTPRTRVLLLVGGAPKPRVLDALSHGARGYLDRRTLRTFRAPGRPGGGRGRGLGVAQDGRQDHGSTRAADHRRVGGVPAKPIRPSASGKPCPVPVNLDLSQTISYSAGASPSVA